LSVGSSQESAGAVRGAPTAEPEDRRGSNFSQRIQNATAALLWQRRLSNGLRQWASEATRGNRGPVSLMRRSSSVDGGDDAAGGGTLMAEACLGLLYIFFTELKSGLLRLHDTEGFWLGRAIRTIVYAVVYVFGTYFLVEREIETGFWDFGRMPPQIFLVIQVSIWTTFLDYIFEMFSGGGALYILSFGSLTMFLTMPLFHILLGWNEFVAYNDGPMEAPASRLPVDDYRLLDLRPHFFLLHHGWLRFIDLYRVNTTLLGKARATSVSIQAVSLFIGIICILLTLAGAVHSIEAAVDADKDFHSFEDFVYFAVVTISTVGAPALASRATEPASWMWRAGDRSSERLGGGKRGPLRADGRATDGGAHCVQRRRRPVR
jgi:hypothetical protein